MVPLLTRLACRAFAVLVLVAGVAIGVHLGVSGGQVKDPRQMAEQDLRAADEEQQATRDWHRDYALIAADSDAEAKAESIAEVAGDQAKALDKAFAEVQAQNSTPDIGPIPADCDEYSGNKAAGCARLLEHGFALDQMPCLEKLWDHESGWNEKAQNGSSGAYGIPQAYPGSKMASAGDDWKTNPNTQINWGLGYISGRYGDPCGAWQHFQDNGSY